MSMDRGFVEQVNDLYAHLYDLVYLRAHPLAELLIPGPHLGAKDRAWQLHHLLLSIIGELEPEPQVPAFSRPWRRHQLMLLRYVKALEPQAVMEQLNISRRHYYREHAIAMEALAGILWSRRALPAAAGEATPSQSVEEQASLGRLELLRLEAARLAEANRYARIDAVLGGILPLLEKVMRQREVGIDVALSGALPSVSSDQSVLRQLLLAAMGEVVERIQQATIRVTAASTGPEVRLSLRVEPPRVLLQATVAPGLVPAEPRNGPDSPSTELQQTVPGDIEERLAALQEMAALCGGRVSAVQAEGSLQGFDLHLPTAWRTVLAVDDNEDVLELYRRYLSAHPYHIITGRTAQEGLDLARRHQPYAICLDLMMPGQDGWDLLQQLLNQPETRHIPVIVCTVLKQKQLALSLGASAFLEKPVTEQALVGALQALGGPSSVKRQPLSTTC